MYVTVTCMRSKNGDVKIAYGHTDIHYCFWVLGIAQHFIKTYLPLQTLTVLSSPQDTKFPLPPPTDIWILQSKQ